MFSKRILQQKISTYIHTAADQEKHLHYIKVSKNENLCLSNKQL